MEYQFHLLSLLIIFLLIVIYYMGRDSFQKENRCFRSILLTTYIMQLGYFSTYIISRNENNTIWISKLYLITIVLWFALFSFYYLVIYLKSKYIENETKLTKKIDKIKKWLIGMQLISMIWILGYPDVIYNQGITIPNIISILIGFYLVTDGIILLKGRKSISSNLFGHLMVLFIIQVFIFGLAQYNGEFSMMNIGILIIVLYCYLTIENPYQKQLKTLQLERDYAIGQSIDKSAFLKNLSHQIRTPLNTIDGFSQIILENSDEKEIKNDIQDIRSASKELIDVINGMIDLSIIESGTLEIINENYNIYDMLDNVIEITKSKMKGTEIEWIDEIDENIPEVLSGDSERISQILLNLVKNAIKYTEKGSITLKVECVKSSTRCRLKFSVIDTGCGIQKEELKTIFDRKEDNLGLAISKHLVDLMGGAIDIESTVEKGTSIIVTIVQKIVMEKQEQTSEQKVLKYFQAKDKRILLVDDNKLNLKVASKLLQPYEVEIVEATSGTECLDILEHDTNFDLILMDDLMPEMSGTECLSILKKIERVDGYYIPVVVLTANVISGMKEKYLDFGFEDYLSKPIDKYELERILKKYLKRKNNEK